MTWLKGLGSSVWVALGFFAAAMTAYKVVRLKETADKWQDKAVDIETGNVVKGVESAKAATTQAKLLHAKAEEVNEKAKAQIDKIGKSPVPIEDILSEWKK